MPARVRADAGRLRPGAPAGVEIGVEIGVEVGVDGEAGGAGGDEVGRRPRRCPERPTAVRPGPAAGAGPGPGVAVAAREVVVNPPRHERLPFPASVRCRWSRDRDRGELRRHCDNRADENHRLSPIDMLR